MTSFEEKDGKQLLVDSFIFRVCIGSFAGTLLESHFPLEDRKGSTLYTAAVTGLPCKLPKFTQHFTSQTEAALLN